MAYTRDELLDALRAFDGEHGRPPTAAECNERAELPSATAYVYNFEGLNAAIEAAGLEPTTRYSYSDDELLSDLRELIDELGRRPTDQDMREREDVASPATYANHFGSWWGALRLAYAGQERSGP